MIEHRVNIDFEYELFDPRFKASNRKYKKLCEEYEFIYFFMEKTELCLSTNRQYDQDYLYYIESIIENKIKLTDYNDNAITWWGSFEDIELEKKLNSKETSFKISEKLMILPEHSYLVKDAINWPKLNQNFKYLIKNPFMMSGRGQKQLIHSNNYNHEKLPIIIEPLHKVVADYGLRIDFQKGLKYFVQLYNINGKQFSGGKIIKVIPKSVHNRCRGLLGQIFRSSKPEEPCLPHPHS